MRSAFVSLALLLGLTACGGPPTSVPTQVLVVPSGALLTPGSPSLALSATVLDQHGAPMEGVTWASSDPDVVTVTDEGVVTATGVVGSAVVTAAAGDASAQVVVVSAVPVEGTVLLRDEDVLGGPTLLEAQPPDVGALYQVRLAVPPPAVGAHVLATGDAQVAGRVSAVSGDDVTLELRPLDELFQELVLDESLDLSKAPLLDDPHQGLTVSRLADGSVHARGTFAGSDGPSPQAEFPAGPLTCKTDLNFGQLDVLNVGVTFTPALSLDVVLDGDHRKVVVRGSPQAVATFEPVVKGVLQGSVGCELKLGDIQVPLPGPLGIFLGAVVPFGIGLKIEGTVPLAEVGYHFDAEVGADLRFGFDCDPDCEPVSVLTPSATGHQRPIVPNDLLALRVDASLSGFLFANLEAGLRSSQAGRVGVASAHAGLKLGAKLASEETQFQDPGYSSGYALDLSASISAGVNVQKFFNLVNVTPVQLKLEVTSPLATSPKATVVRADRESFAAGDTVTFTVELNPASIAFPFVGYNVGAVRVYNATSGSLVLANEVTATPGQQTFEVEWVATQDGEVGDKFVAFVETELLSSPRLELGVVEPPSEPGTATLDFTITFEEHFEDAAPGFRERRDEVETLTGQYSLDVVSRDDEAIVFEVLSGTLAFSHTTESVTEEDGETGVEPECTYTEVVTITHDAAGTLAVPAGAPGTFRVDLAEVGEYALTFSPSLSFEVPAVDGYSSNGGCGIEPIQDSDDDVEEVDPGFVLSGLTLGGDPNVFSGSLSTGDPGWGTTYTWSLVITPP